MRFCKKTISFAEAVLFFLSPAAAEEKAHFAQISIEEGLSQRTVYAIVQDGSGYLWFGTQDGLNRYDGYALRVYKNNVSDSLSLSDNRVRRLFVDSKSQLWVGTRFGLNRYDPATDTFVRFYHEPGNASGLSDNDIRALHEDRAGTLWIGTNKGGVTTMRFDDNGSPRFQHFNRRSLDEASLADHSVLDIVEDPAGTIWIATLGGGLFAFDPAAETVARFVHHPEEPNSLSSDFVMALHCDENGYLWIGTYGGGVNRLKTPGGPIIRFTHAPQKAGSLGSNRVLSIYEDRNHTLWFGTLGSGLDKLTAENALVRAASARTRGADELEFIHFTNEPGDPHSLNDTIVRSIYEDRSGNLWVGTNTSGVNKLDLKPAKFAHVKLHPGAPEHSNLNSIYAIYKENDATVWVGTNEALARLTPDSHAFQTVLNTQIHGARFPGYVSSIIPGEDSLLWIGTYGNGFFRYDRKKNRASHFLNKPDDPNSLSNNRVRCVFKDHFGFVWVGTADGLNRYDPAEGGFRIFRNEAGKENSLTHNDISVIFEDSGNNLWIGTSNGGLCLFDWESESFRAYKADPRDANSLSNDSITEVYEDPQGNLWIGTSNGLNKMNPAGTFVRYFESHGLPNAYIAGILGDDSGRLWISTNKGLSRFSPEAPAERFRNYDVDDGLQGLVFEVGSRHRSADGELFFGGVRGFNRFYPDRIRESDFLPPVVITAFRKFGKDMVRGDPIRLNHKENYFSIEFAALDFSFPERNQYAYRLDGLDSDWVYSGTRRFVTYSNLRPGNYVFRVKGSNNDGIWNEQGASLNIVITPPYWATWWFRVAAALFVTGLLLSAYKYRVARLLEIERTRNRIAQDLHDEVGATLSSISYFVQAIRGEPEVRSLADTERFLTLIAESSSEAQEAMSDIIWAIDPANDKWQRILAKFRRHAADLFESTGIRYEIAIPEDLSIDKLNMEQRRNLWLLYKEMITNIVKHSRCHQAKVTITTTGNELFLQVEDDGQGFDTRASDHGNGLRNIRRRAQQLNAEISLRSQKGKGTSWEVRFNV